MTVTQGKQLNTYSNYPLSVRPETGRRAVTKRVKALSVVGARPQFVKLAPVHQALSEQGHEHLIVHTGQHYDRLLSRAFFDDLEIPPPRVNLGVGSGSHAAQTAGVLTGLEQVLDEARPDWVLV